VTALTMPDVGRLLFSAARPRVTVTAEDGSAVADFDARVTAGYNLDGQPTLVAVDGAGREMRIPVHVMFDVEQAAAGAR
jgi:hypothetical protein